MPLAIKGSPRVPATVPVNLRETLSPAACARSRLPQIQIVPSPAPSPGDALPYPAPLIMSKKTSVDDALPPRLVPLSSTPAPRDTSLAPQRPRVLSAHPQHRYVAPDETRRRRPTVTRTDARNQIARAATRCASCLVAADAPAAKRPEKTCPLRPAVWPDHFRIQ